METLTRADLVFSGEPPTSHTGRGRPEVPERKLTQNENQFSNENAVLRFAPSLLVEIYIENVSVMSL